MSTPGTLAEAAAMTPAQAVGATILAAVVLAMSPAAAVATTTQGPEPIPSRRL